jgi:hypothetical protein
MKLQLLLIFSLFIVTFRALAFSETKWELQSDKEGIQIYTKDVEGAKFKQVKGVTNVPISLEHLVSILTDFNNYHIWNEHISESHVVSTSDDTTHYVYTMEDTPWPVQNRYHVSKMTVSKSDAQCMIHFESVPDFVEKRVDAIEMKRQRGFWRLSALPEGGCTIEFFMDKNPGGYVPAWLVNYLIIETPFKTLHNLRELIDRHPRP